MVDPGHPGTTALGAYEWTELDESYDPESVAAPRCQHLSELGVVDPSADECAADVVGQVEVAERDCISVAESPRTDLGRGPDTHSANAAKPAIDRGTIERRGGQPFELWPDPGGGLCRTCSSRVDSRRVPLP